MLGERQSLLKEWLEVDSNPGLPKELRIIRLWAIAQMDYRGEVGELALDALRELVGGTEALTALMFITGWLQGGKMTDQKLFELVSGKPGMV